jgi:hypothetical protein
MLETGTQGVYEWLVTDKNFDLLHVCPEIVVGKYIAVTSFDSGPLSPTEEEMAAGWQSRGNIAYSPRIQSPQDVPRGGWDEWYIFENPSELGVSHLAENVFEVPHENQHLSVFVNYNFALHLQDVKELASLFWEQIARIQPESYVGDNYFLNFVTADKSLFARVRDVIEPLT